MLLLKAVKGQGHFTSVKPFIHIHPVNQDIGLYSSHLQPVQPLKAVILNAKTTPVLRDLEVIVKMIM